MLGPRMTASVPRLYSQPGSHPCAAVEAALALKRIEYDRVDLLPLTQMLVGPLRYGGTTVPGMRIGGERILGSRAIMRRLDALAPEPPLLPAEQALRTRVLDVERWGDEVFQSVPRRIIWAAFVRAPRTMEGYAGDAKLPLPTAAMRPALGLTARMAAARNHAGDENARADLAELPDQLARIDEWIGEGVLGGELPNAADLQVGCSLRLLMTIGDVRPLVQERRAAALVGYFPPIAGEIPPGTLPSSWLSAVASAPA
jgi:glutathione S-transferase